MTHADAFLQDILENPEDDTPRLIYADWLEARGGPGDVARAELIRVQCALASRAGGDRAALESRERQLLERHGEEWARPLRGLVTGWTFHRGFVGEVRAEARAFLAGADELFRRAPVQHVHLHWRFLSPPQPVVNIPELVECAHLGRLCSLDLSYSYLGSGGVHALAVCEHLTWLTTLRLAANHVGDSGVRALAGAPWLAGLTHLDLSDNDIGPAGVRALAVTLEGLAGSGEGLRLRTLDLGGNRLRAAGRSVIRSSPLLYRVARY